jgi:RNA polymerase sigma factor (sigma-70 family)
MMQALTAPPETNAASPIDVEQLFRVHKVHLYRFVRRYVRNNEDAEDVVQLTFLEAVRCAPRFAGLSKPSTWLFGIALNLARNQLRRSCADLTDTVDESILEQIGDSMGDPARLVEARQTVRLAQARLAAMPAAMQDTFEAVLEGDASYEEAALQLGIPVGTVRSRVSRVRDALRAGLA